MCGIFGVIFRDKKTRADAARVVAARETLRHRGPDEAGLWLRDGVALAHRRLKVLDLVHGQQPAVSADERFALVYNGEVYNFHDLRKHYAAAGASFETRCDTEVVFHALMHENAAALDRFNGMFALGFWDDAQRRLLLARDRLGKKPLYWFADDSLLVFASELKAVLEYLGRRFDVDPAALEQFFSRGYVLAPRTIFQQIQKLPAGNLLRLDASAGRWDITVEPWWDFEYRQTPRESERMLDELDELLSDAVRLRLVSDVPAGCLLSGGVDSSLITGMAAKASGQGVAAFTIGFEESAAHDESRFAEAVAKKHGCRWIHRQAGGDDFLASIESVVAHFDEPFGNFTAPAMHKLARMAKEELTVVLTGQGGDELAGGYSGRYNWAMQTRSSVLQKYAPPIDALNDHLAHTRFLPWLGGLDRILSEPLRQSFIDRSDPLGGAGEFWYRFREIDRLPNVLYTDIKTNLPDYLICLEERMTMACGLEARNPMLDYRVVNFMLSLPLHMLFRDDKNKWPLVTLARRYAPAEAIDRPKQGFTPPLALWMQRHADVIVQMMASVESQLRPLLSAEWWEHLMSGRFDARTTMGDYYCLVLAIWIRNYGKYIASWPLDAKPAASASQGQFHRVYRVQDPVACDRARWFCQALTNFDRQTPLRVEGDDADFYRFLARQWTTKVTAAPPAEALVIVGMDAILCLCPDILQPNQLRPGATVLLLASVRSDQAAEADRLLAAVRDWGTVRGFQPVAIAPAEALLILKLTTPAAVAPQPISFATAQAR